MTKLTPTEKRELAELKAQLAATGKRGKLWDDAAEQYVLSFRRIAELEAREADCDPKQRPGITKAISAAKNENRQLRKQLLGKADADAEQMTPAQIAEARRILARNEAWRAYIHLRNGNISEEDIAKKHGPRREANAALFASIEDELENILN